LIDFLENQNDFKDPLKFKGAPTFSDFCAELSKGEDVILKVDITNSDAHTLVGAACSKTPNKDGTYNVSFVDPAKGKTIHTKMRKHNGKWQVKYNGAWKDMPSMVAVSPIKKK